MTKEELIIQKVKEKGSLKFRVYAKFLRLLIAPILRKKIIVDKFRQADYAYITICQQKDFDMVYASIYSLYRNALIVPNEVVVVSDGSWEPEVAVAYFKKRGFDIKAISWRVCANYYRELCPKLREWAEKQIWGKKMAAILYLSENRKVLFSDPDILWYGNPLSSKDLEKLFYKVSVDNATSYDQDCIKKLNLDVLNQRIPINCGAVYFYGGLKNLNDNAFACVKYEAENCGPFAEQTVFAALDLKYDSRWTMQEITSEIDDLFYIFSFKKNIRYPNMIARHYLYFLKWIYWKEYIRMLFFIGKK